MAVKNRIPFAIAAALTAVFFLPLTMFLGKYNVPLWVSFIVWAEYFVFGARLKEAGSVILPCFPAGSLICAVGWILSFALVPLIPAARGLWAHWIGFGLIVALMVKALDYVPVLRKGSLAYYNGMTMTIAVLFTHSYPALSEHPLMQPVLASAWTIMAGLFGLFLGWFNVTLTFPREVGGK